MADPALSLYLDYSYEICKEKLWFYSEEEHEAKFQSIIKSDKQTIIPINYVSESVGNSAAINEFLKSINETIGFIVVSYDSDICKDLNVECLIDDFYIKPRYRNRNQGGLTIAYEFSKLMEEKDFKSYAVFMPLRGFRANMIKAWMLDRDGYTRSYQGYDEGIGFYFWRKSL